jgi:predicted nicotinamide N-methyase
MSSPRPLPPSPLPPTLVYPYELRDGGAPLSIHQDPHAAWQAGIGATVWDCGLCLCKHLERRGAGAFAGKRVIDIGAGTGLVGLVLSRLGASVLLTDQACALPLLAYNVAQNCADSAGASDHPRVAIGKLTWGEARDVDALRSQHPDFFPPDLIVASDCVVWPELVGPLFETLRLLAGANSPSASARVVMSYEDRGSDNVTAALRAALPPGARRISASEMDEEYSCHEIELLEWTFVAPS